MQATATSYTAEDVDTIPDANAVAVEEDGDADAIGGSENVSDDRLRCWG